jgi:hypothetical protein
LLVFFLSMVVWCACCLFFVLLCIFPPRISYQFQRYAWFASYMKVHFLYKNCVARGCSIGAVREGGGAPGYSISATFSPNGSQSAEGGGVRSFGYPPNLLATLYCPSGPVQLNQHQHEANDLKSAAVPIWMRRGRDRVAQTERVHVRRGFARGVCVYTLYYTSVLLYTRAAWVYSSRIKARSSCNFAQTAWVAALSIFAPSAPIMLFTTSA